MVKISTSKKVALLLAGIILLAVFAGCTQTEKTPLQEFSKAKGEVSVIDTENFQCFKEFVINVVLEEEGIQAKDFFIKIDSDDTITVHVLSNADTYTVYAVEAKRNNRGIAEAITSEDGFVYLESHDDAGNETYIQRPFNEFIWNAYYNVEGDRIIIEP